MPKSSTRGCVRPTMKMLAGLMSRWITPFECAKASASATRRTISAACAGVARQPSWRSWRRSRPLQQLHRDVGALVADAGVEHGDDVRMAEAAGGARLVEEQRVERLALRLGDLDVQRLDRDQARQQRIVRREDGAEAAFAELVLERVAADVADRRHRAIGGVATRPLNAIGVVTGTAGGSESLHSPTPGMVGARGRGLGVGGGHGRRGRTAHRASLSDPTAGAAVKNARAPTFVTQAHH